MFRPNSLLKRDKWPFILFILFVSIATGTLFVYESLPTAHKPKDNEMKLVEDVKEVRPDILGAAQQPNITPTPINTPIKIGLVVDDYSNKSGQISNREIALGSAISTISIFKQFGLPSNANLVPEDLAYIKSRGINLMIAWEPWNPTEGLNQSVDYIKEIPEGKHDEYLKSFALQIKEYGAPVSLRFGHEMNGDWYPWGQKPHMYIQSYRRIVELFKNEGVTNVKWVWSVNATPTLGLRDYYPGSEYVDVVGIDGFNFGASQPGHTWVSFKQIFNSSYNIVASYNKPIIITETASSEIGGSKSMWIKGMFDTISLEYSDITEVVWFDINKETDWRIDSSNLSLQAFVQSN